MSLVPGRRCGECMVCCITPLIDTPELAKPPNVACINCVPSGGCAIHDRRPEGCRTYYCGWRQLEELDDTWRPDRCSVLIELQDTDIPEHYSKRCGIRLTVVGPIKTILQKGFLDYVMQLVEAQTPVFLNIPGPPGYESATTFLNELMRDAVTVRDFRRVAGVLAQILKYLSAFELKPVILKHRGASEDGCRTN